MCLKLPSVTLHVVASTFQCVFESYLRSHSFSSLQTKNGCAATSVRRGGMPIIANSRSDTKVHLKEDVFANFGSTLVTCTAGARKAITRTMRLCVKSALLCLALVGTAA